MPRIASSTVLLNFLLISLTLVYALPLPQNDSNDATPSTNSGLEVIGNAIPNAEWFDDMEKMTKLVYGYTWAMIGLFSSSCGIALCAIPFGCCAGLAKLKSKPTYNM